MDALPHRFGDRTPIADGARRARRVSPPASASGASYRLAGRVMAAAARASSSFLDLEDRSGRLQLLASADGLGEEMFERGAATSSWATSSASRARPSPRGAASCRCS